MDGADEQKTLPTYETGDDAGARSPRVLVSCATIVYHPDPSRIGERRLLRHATRPLELSRNELTFNRPRDATDPRALEDPYLSRDPITLRVGRTGAVRLGVSPDHGVRIDGGAAAAETELTVERLERGVEIELAKRVVVLLHRADASPSTEAHDLIGESPAIESVRRAIQSVADLSVGVLIRGETGVGKDHVARAIHAASGRAGPHIAVNAAVLSRSTAASELFGHARGAFTDARAAHEGLFAQASGGTLFLDEIGELESDVQGMLLRALESGQVRPLGGSEDVEVDTRVIAATDASLEDLVRQGGFRPALLHRLSAFSIQVPTLRERRDDIARLAMSFFAEELESIGQSDRLALRSAKDRPWLHRRIMTGLLRYDWPGNVRQLRNVVRQIVIGSRGFDRAELDDALEAQLTGVRAPAKEAPSSTQTVSPDQLLQALEAHGWAFGPAARELGVNRTTFYRLVEGHPEVRKGTDLSAEELKTARDATGGDLDAMSQSLRVSRRAIRLRMNELEID